MALQTPFRRLKPALSGCWKEPTHLRAALKLPSLLPAAAAAAPAGLPALPSLAALPPSPPLSLSPVLFQLLLVSLPALCSALSAAPTPLPPHQAILHLLQPPAGYHLPGANPHDCQATLHGCCALSAKQRSNIGLEQQWLCQRVLLHWRLQAMPRLLVPLTQLQQLPLAPLFCWLHS